MLEQSDIDRIKDAAALPSIAGRYTALKKQGRSWSGLCCFHREKTPSLRVHERYFKCFGCGAGGDVFAFVRQIEGCTFIEAVKIVADFVGYSIEAYTPARIATMQHRRRVRGDALATRADLLRELRTDRGQWWSRANEIDRMVDDLGTGPDDPAAWLLTKDAADQRFTGDVVDQRFLEIERMSDDDYIDLYQQIQADAAKAARA